MIPAEAVEAAAIVHCNRGDSDWRDWTEDAKAEARQDMRAALEAAAPHMVAGAWEQGYMCSYDQERGGTGDGPTPVPEYLADDLAQWNPYRPTP